ncbi:MAG: peptidoglycan DD-metalloendopeptidase family protein [Micromonosporaceae bacterium]|nr:peptidoglycan DD-metalloendopeptidase family protein [Micromonosporaceae bacterium]
MLQRLYDAQTKQRSLRNQIAVASVELADAQDAVAAAKAGLRGARVARDRARHGFQDSVVTIYKSGAPYGLYHALESPSVLRDGAHGQLSAFGDASDRVDLLADELAAAVDGRDALLSTLTDLRRSLRQADDAVTGIQRKTAKNLSGAVPDSGTPAGVVDDGKPLRPVRGAITSGYGNRFDPYYQQWQLHAGVDIAAPTGTAVRAASTGRVTQAGWNGGYGNYICLAHGQVRGQPMTTCYAHLSRIHVAAGQTMTRGQRIGDVGSTGASTGPHLHFEVRFGGRPADPRLWL